MAAPQLSSKGLCSAHARPCTVKQRCVQPAAWERRGRPGQWGQYVPAAAARCVHTHAITSFFSHRRRIQLRSVAAGNGVTAGERVGIVIVDHGSRKKTSNEMLVEFVEVYKHVTGASIVEVAHMEIAEPTIDQAVGKCVAQGINKVVVAPYFLSRGRHIQEDIPALVADARAKYKIECVIADPIGVDPLMAKLIQNRVEAALQKSQVPA